jgi:hypothetical protein
VRSTLSVNLLNGEISAGFVGLLLPVIYHTAFLLNVAPQLGISPMLGVRPFPQEPAPINWENEVH